MAKSYATGRSVTFQPHSQDATSGTWAPSSANACAPATTRGSSRPTPSFSLNSTRCRIMFPCRSVRVGQVVHELPDALGRVRNADEPYLYEIRGSGRLVDDRVEHEDHYHVRGDFSRLRH